MRQIILATLVLISLKSFSTEVEKVELKKESALLDIFVNVGANLRSGYFTTEDSKTTWNLALHLLPQESGFFSLEMIHDSFKHDTSEFPFPANSTVSVSGSAFMANAGGHLYKNTLGYFGIGLGKFDLATDDAKYTQSYGSWVYQFNIIHQITENWLFGYKIQHWKSEFTSNDKITFGEMRGHYLTIGYRWM